ncbi:MAG: N-acetylmuramoyl-L-alanine amidase [Deltaproteobacteria bacterium]|nr:MAG: N-acetylmuramoyl-L-alanine amidase [Deltaproteobacteria bacterium]
MSGEAPKPHRLHRIVIALVLIGLGATSAPAHPKPTGSRRAGQHGPEITDWPLRFDAERIALTKAYIKKHYGLTPTGISIVPRAVVVHWTVTPSLKGTWRGFNRVRLRSSRKHILRGGHLNVSAHFLVSRKGKIYRLMSETQMARHCIGLNYDSIGIENVGGGKRWPLTKAQLSANVALIRYLVAKHPTIRYMLGHMEWKRFEKAPFFRELDPTYRNAKPDPGRRFMRGLRRRLRDLKLADRYRK